MGFSAIIDAAGALCTSVVGKALLAILVFIVGRAVIKWALKRLGSSKAIAKLEPSVGTIVVSIVKIALYTLLTVSIIGILGVPMASITAVIAACAATVGLALQGTLSSFAAGIEILILHPYAIGDYISAAGVEGIVKSINMFFTVIVTIDNKRVTVSNGAIMGGTVTNFTAEGTRRVELTFKAPAGTDSALVLETLRATACANELVLKDGKAPEEPYSHIVGAGDGLVEYMIRAWCTAADYWTVYFGLIEEISAALGAAGVKPGIPQLVVTEKGEN